MTRLAPLLPSRLTGLALTLLLIGCQTTPLPPEQDPRFAIPTGSTLTLHEPLTIPAGRVSVYFQNGRAYPSAAGVNTFAPSCKFEVRSLVDRERTVEADTFVVRRARRDWEYVEQRVPVMVAGLSLNGGADDDAGGPLFSIESRILDLASERQPDVYRLTCSHQDDIAFAEPLTVAQIRTALGPLFTFRLPGNGD